MLHNERSRPIGRTEQNLRQELDYESLGSLMKAAGVAPDRAEAMVTRFLDNHGSEQLARTRKHEIEFLRSMLASDLETIRLDYGHTLSALAIDMKKIHGRLDLHHRTTWWRAFFTGLLLALSLIAASVLAVEITTHWNEEHSSEDASEEQSGYADSGSLFAICTVQSIGCGSSLL